jgi:hypothetical protein
MSIQHAKEISPIGEDAGIRIWVPKELSSKELIEKLTAGNVPQHGIVFEEGSELMTH